MESIKIYLLAIILMQGLIFGESISGDNIKEIEVKCSCPVCVYEYSFGSDWFYINYDEFKKHLNAIEKINTGTK